MRLQTHLDDVLTQREPSVCPTKRHSEHVAQNARLIPCNFQHIEWNLANILYEDSTFILFHSAGVYTSGHWQTARVHECQNDSSVLIN